MQKFEIGDWVYAGDWCYGQIVDSASDGAGTVYYYVEFDTGGGGGCLSFELSELEPAPSPEEESSATSAICYAVRVILNGRCGTQPSIFQTKSEAIAYTTKLRRICENEPGVSTEIKLYEVKEIDF